MSGRIEILEKNLMIRASAGSGKTYQLGNRVIGLVGGRGVDPERLVALTFTRKAAGEFADAVLRKLAEAAVKPETERKLREETGEALEARPTLARVVRALPRLSLGTMDSFFSRIVRGFQYELGLTGGTFELVEGPKLEGMLAELLAGILLDALDGDEGEEFLQAFRRATLGKEESQVRRLLADFFKQWHEVWRGGGVGATDGLAGLPEVEEWERRKVALLGALRREVATTTWSDKRQEAGVLKLIDTMELHRVGSGVLTDAGSTLFSGVRRWFGEGGPCVLKLWKEFELSEKAAALLREALKLVTECELAAAVVRTEAVAGLVARYDRECERRLRSRGLLGFNDVKVLMGEWSRSEEARLRREQVDFRLDARYDHWLLDEFQDTSPAEWRGIEPLIDEAVSDEEGSLFVVGDPKQAIYGWRGGDVRLFDELQARYGRGLEVASMPESWRSCQAVLELVNRVCGDLSSIEGLFGEAVAARWPWEEHVPARDGVTGEARVEVVEGKEVEDRRQRLVELLRELGVGERAMTCGVLVRTNDEVREVAELLRSEGFAVIEEGRRLPTVDNPVGVALFQLVRWLADPADALAREVVAMSPLAGAIEKAHEGPWERAWEALLAEARTAGFAGVLERLVEAAGAEWSEFGRRRAADVLGALGAFDAGGGVSAREAARWLEGLEVAQSPGVAAVQVMTVHKSKGLGFDVVVLPAVEDTQVPNAGRLEILRGDGWVLDAPPRWVRECVPVLAEAERRWGEEQRYEALCVTYVALTRAKRGLYVLLSEEPDGRKGKEDEFASPANWLRRALGIQGTGVVFQTGDPAWIESVPPREVTVNAPELPALGEARSRRKRATPSGEKKAVASTAKGSASGRAYGSAVHRAFEGVAWVDEERPVLGEDDGARRVAELLEIAAVREAFERRGRNVELFREVPFEAIVDGRWMSGVIDRLHVWRDLLGMVERVEVIDFKTDAVTSPDELVERYAAQMAAYRRVMAEVYPGAAVDCRLLAVGAAKWVMMGF